jgi:catechol 2,3-dioxygenase-like lactoylglutathione lyase family enzyme
MSSDSAPGHLRWTTVCLDCADAEEMAAFYGKVLGWEITAGGGPWILMRDPAGGVGLSFQAEEWYEPPVWPEESRAQTKMLTSRATSAPGPRSSGTARNARPCGASLLLVD